MVAHLLLDYDRAADIPGATLAGTDDWKDPPEPGYDPPTSGVWLEIIAKRLRRAGYAVKVASLARSTNGWHGKVQLDRKPRSPMEIVALQAMLGSDPLRESCNIQRARVLERMDLEMGIARLVSDAESALHREETELLAAAELVIELRRLLEVWPRNGLASFYRDRWNTLYQPNPRRRKTNGPSE